MGQLASYFHFIISLLNRIQLVFAILLLSLIVTACGQAGQGSGGDSREIAQTVAARSTGAALPASKVQAPTSDQPTPAQASGLQDIQASSLASTLLNANVLGQEGSKLGSPASLIVDALAGQVQYLTLETSGSGPNRRGLLPWGVFQPVLAPELNSSTNRNAETLAFRLAVSDQDLAGAPDLDAATLDDRSKWTTGWDQASRKYWAGKAAELPVTGGTEQTPGALIDFRKSPSNSSAYPVRSVDGEPFGEIQDLVIRPDGSLAFALLQPAEGLHLGETRLPVAWKALTWNTKQGAFSMVTPAEVLKTVPPFDSAHLPDMTVPGWEQDWERFWETNLPGAQPAGQSTAVQATIQPGQPVLLSALIGSQVADQNGQVLGELSDWLFDSNGLSNYGVLQENQRFIPIPWLGLAWKPVEAGGQPGRAALMLNLDAAVLQKAPAFDRLEMLTTDTAWYERATAYWKNYVQPAAPGSGTPTPAAEPGLISAVTMLKSTAVDHAQNALGPLSDIILGPDGMLRYAVLSLNNQFRPLPWTVYEFNFDTGRLVYLDDPQRLNLAPGYAAIRDIQLTSPQWDQDLRTYWGMK